MPGFLDPISAERAAKLQQDSVKSEISAVFFFFFHLHSHINRRTQFENPVLEAKRRLQQQQQMQSQGLSSLPLPTIYRGKTTTLVSWLLKGKMCEFPIIRKTNHTHYQSVCSVKGNITVIAQSVSTQSKKKSFIMFLSCQNPFLFFHLSAHNVS